MTTPQQKFFATLDEAAEDEGLEVVTSFSASNVGTIHLLPKDSFDTLLAIPFNFQGARLALGWQAGSLGHDVFPSRPNPRFAQFQLEQYPSAIAGLIASAQNAKGVTV